MWLPDSELRYVIRVTRQTMTLDIISAPTDFNSQIAPLQLQFRETNLIILDGKNFGWSVLPLKVKSGKPFLPCYARLHGPETCAEDVINERLELIQIRVKCADKKSMVRLEPGLEPGALSKTQARRRSSNQIYSSFMIERREILFGLSHGPLVCVKNYKTQGER